jgi:transposase
MFVRMKSYKNQDGSSRHYLFLVAAKRIGGHVRQVTVANLGRVEDAEKIIPEMVEKISKYSKTLKVINLAKDMKSDWSKEYGPVIIFKKIWEKIGLGRLFEKYLQGRKIEFDAGEILWGMVLNRLIEPKSELATHEWIKELYGIKGAYDLNQWYRALDFLIEHKDELEMDLYHSQMDLFHQEIDMVLMDTTSVVYFGDGDKAEDILDYGYSKEKRFDLKQVIVGILMTKEGIPLGHEVYPGNTNDINAFREMIRMVSQRFKIRRVIIVCDRGMINQKNIRQLELDNYEYIVGMRMRQLKREDAEKILSRGDMKSLTKGLKGKEVFFEKKRLVVCFSEEEAKKDLSKREEIIARLIEKLKTQGLKSLLVHKEYSKYLKIKAEKPELDEEKIKAEELFDGKFVLQTNTKLDWKEIVSAYKDLWQVEAAFRTLKSELEMGPIYHYTERRIRAHIFICFLALLLKVAFHKELLKIDKALSVNKVLDDIKKIKAVQISLKDMPLILRTELEGNAHYAFKAVGLKIPPRFLTETSIARETVVVRL